MAGREAEGLATTYDAADALVLELRAQGKKLVSQKSHTFDALGRLVTEPSTGGMSPNPAEACSPGGNLLGGPPPHPLTLEWAPGCILEPWSRPQYR